MHFDFKTSTNSITLRVKIFTMEDVLQGLVGDVHVRTWNELHRPLHFLARLHIRRLDLLGYVILAKYCDQQGRQLSLHLTPFEIRDIAFVFAKGNHVFFPEILKSENKEKTSSNAKNRQTVILVAKIEWKIRENAENKQTLIYWQYIEEKLVKTLKIKKLLIWREKKLRKKTRENAKNKQTFGNLWKGQFEA